MKTKKIPLAILTLLVISSLTACNGSRDKSNTDSQGGQSSTQSQTAGNDSSHTTDNRRSEVGGVPPAGTVASGNTSANGTTTAQGMTGADSVYQKGTQKSPK